MHYAKSPPLVLYAQAKNTVGQNCSSQNHVMRGGTKVSIFLKVEKI